MESTRNRKWFYTYKVLYFCGGDDSMRKKKLSAHGHYAPTSQERGAKERGKWQ